LKLCYERSIKNKKEQYTKESKTMNPTLVSGFEDIITHIKQQEQRIMSLEQQNKDLKWKLTVKIGQVDFHKQVVDGDHFILKEKFKKLEEENKKLKEKYEEGLKHVLTLTDEKKQLEEENQTYKETLDEHFHHYELLKEKKNKEIAELKEKYEEGLKHVLTLTDEKTQQKKDHIKSLMNTKRIANELYREMKYALGYGEFDEPDRKVMYDEIKKLKEENK